MNFDEFMALAEKVPQREYTRDESFMLTALLFKAEKVGEHAVHYLSQFSRVQPAQWEVDIAIKSARAAATFARIYLDLLDKTAALDEHDRAVRQETAKRCAEIAYQLDPDPLDKEIYDAIIREFGLEGNG